MPLEPTLELIEAKSIVEGADYEFKRQVDFGDARQKSNFVDDVVAFLNAERGGYIIVGVKETGGAFSGYSPLQEDPDQLVRRVLSLVQDNIDPRPLNIDVQALAIEGGSVVRIAIPVHRMGPYQNRITGGFYVRTGAKNTPLRRDELGAYFVDQDRYESELRLQMGYQDGTLRQRQTMASGGPGLNIGVLPREHFDRGRGPFEQRGNVLFAAPGYHSGSRHPFRGADSGHEAIEVDGRGKAIGRVVVTDDWFIHARAVHPFDYDGSGRVRFDLFRETLTQFLASLDTFVQREEILGPYGLSIYITDLRANDKIAWIFERADSVGLPRMAWVEKIADPDVIDRLHSRLLSVTVHR